MVRPVVLFFVVGVSVLSFAGQRPAPVRDMRVERVGTGLLAGIVTDAAQPARPLRNAMVTLNSDAFIGPRLATTDDNGRFEFGRLPEGRYTLVATKAAYLTIQYGASKPRRSGTSVVLADGQRVANLKLAIPRGAVITGRVRNTAGEPVSSMLVTALHSRFYNGERRLVNFAAPRAMTDSRGEYRLYGLESGDYRVVVEPSADARGIEDVAALADTDVDRALAERQPTMQPPTAPQVASTRRVGLAPVFHPGTANSALASKVTVAVGEERSGIDIRLELVPMARIDGTVTTPDGRDLSGVQVILTSLGAPAPTGEFAGATLSPRTPDAAGRFSFAAVPPGEYRVMATTRPRSQPGSGRGGGGGGARGGAAPGPEPPADPNPLVAFAFLTINGNDQSIALNLQPAMTMSGRVIAEGATQVSSAGTRIVLEDVRIDQSGSVFRSTGDAGADGAFRVNHLWPARFRVTFTLPPEMLAAGWAVKSMTSNGRDLLDAPFELQPYQSLSDVIVTLMDRTSALSGTLQNSSGTPTSDFFIVVFAADRQYWFPNSRRVTSARPNSDGAYNLRNLPAGDYFIAAVTDVEDGEWFDREFLNALRASSPMQISIAAGERKQQNLQIRR